MIELRPMTRTDLGLVASWLSEPHVSRWWLGDTTAEAELAEITERVIASGDRATQMLTICESQSQDHGDAAPIGWCQWYPYDAYPDDAAALGAQVGDCGLDYAIGDPAAVGRGLGTQMIAALIAEIRRQHPGCGLIVDPDARNVASRRVLEHNGFVLLAVRPVASEPNDHPMAIYRLPGAIR